LLSQSAMGAMLVEFEHCAFMPFGV
jgi:hypothetical protein